MLCSGLERPKAELRECHHQLDEPHEGRILAEVPCKADSLQCFGMEEGKRHSLVFKNLLTNYPLAPVYALGT